MHSPPTQLPGKYPNRKFRTVALPALAILAGILLGQLHHAGGQATSQNQSDPRPPIPGPLHLTRGQAEALMTQFAPPTRPSTPSVGLFVHATEVDYNQPLSIVVEVTNRTASAITIPAILRVDYQAIRDGQPVPWQSGPGVGPPTDQLKVVLRLTFPYPPPGRQGPSPLQARQARLFADNPQGALLESDKSTFKRLELPPRFFRPGDNTLELTLVRQDQTIATSGPITIHCSSNDPSLTRPAGPPVEIRWGPAATSSK